ncbi:MAG: YlzJ-like family protein [Clostridia bacterium]|nr:YlzJ-like family protein [Clostridia bacterium]
MILWTPLYLEQVFEGLDKERPPYEEIEYLGRKVEIERTEDHQIRLIRLYSSNPLDYLDNRFQPGQLLNISPNMAKK